MRASREIAHDNLDHLHRNSTTANQDPLSEPGALGDAARQATELAAFAIVAGRGLVVLLHHAIGGPPEEMNSEQITDGARTSVSSSDSPDLGG